MIMMNVDAHPTAPFLVSTTSLKLKIPSVVAPGEGKEYPVRKLAFIDTDGSEVTKRVKVPIITHVTKTLSIPNDRGVLDFKKDLSRGNVFIVDEFEKEIRHAGFKEPRFGRGMTSAIEFEKVVEHDGKKFECKVSAWQAKPGKYESTAKLLPYATHESRMQSHYAHEPLGPRSIPAMYKPTLAVTAGLFGDPAASAPASIVNSCKADVERALNASAIRVKNFPENPITMDEYNDLRLGNE
jgi:hypothetical protein